LLHVKANLVGGLAGDDVDFGVFPGFYFDAAIGDVVDHNHRAGVDCEMFFDMLPRGPAADWPENRKATAPSAGIMLCSDPSEKPQTS